MRPIHVIVLSLCAVLLYSVAIADPIKPSASTATDGAAITELEFLVTANDDVFLDGHKIELSSIMPVLKRLPFDTDEFVRIHLESDVDAKFLDDVQYEIKRAGFFRIGYFRTHVTIQNETRQFTLE